MCIICIINDYDRLVNDAELNIISALNAARAQHNGLWGKLKEAADMLDMAECIAAGTYIQDMDERENEKKISGYILYSLKSASN